MKRSSYWLLVLLIFAFSTAVTAQVSDDTVRIGVLTDLNGPYTGAAGLGSQIAAELAAADFDARVAGAPIEVFVADHENDPEVAKREARRLHEELKADLIVGMPSSAAALAAQQYARDKDVAIIHTGSGTPLLTGKRCSANSLHWQYNTKALTVGITEALEGSGEGLDWYIIALDHPFGYGVHEGIRNALADTKDEIVGKFFHPYGERRFFALIEDAVSRQADVIAIGNAGEGLITAIRQAKGVGVGVKGIRLVSVLTLLTDIRSIGLYAAAGLRFVAPFYWDQNAGSRAFAERFRKRYGGAPGSNHIAVYTATLHYLKAVAEVGGDDSAAVVGAMKRMPVDDGITRNGRVREDGRMVHDLNFIEVKRADEVDKPQAYYRVLEVLPGKVAFGPPNAECPLVERKDEA